MVSHHGGLLTMALHPYQLVVQDAWLTYECIDKAQECKREGSYADALFWEWMVRYLLERDSHNRCDDL
jgi:hypothetical protein